MLRPNPRRPRARRGAILLVVLALLALFAVIGLSFALYAESEATAARIHRESTVRDPDEIPDATDGVNLAFRHIIYPVPDNDPNLTQAAFRGYELARHMYGYNSTVAANISPYSGTGPITATQSPGNIIGTLTRDGVLNFAYQPTLGIIVDPEWTSTRTAIGTFPGAGQQYQSVAAPYTYPGTKDLYLAVMDPTTGLVVQPSYHRFGPPVGTSPMPTWVFNAAAPPDLRLAPPAPALGRPNLDWLASNPAGRMKILRPRPEDHMHDPDGAGPQPATTEFPYPPPNPDGSYTGDVQNLVYGQGRQRNDSVWLFPGLPNGQVRKWRGKDYAVLVAPLVIELNGRVNLNTAGNLKAPTGLPAPNNFTHASHRGASAHEVNPIRVFELADPNATAALRDLLLGKAQHTTNGTTGFVAAGGRLTVAGRYGAPAGDAGATPPNTLATAAPYPSPPPNPLFTNPNPAVPPIAPFNAIVYNGGRVPPIYGYWDVDAATNTTATATDRLDPAGGGATRTSPFPDFPANRFRFGADTTVTQTAPLPPRPPFEYTYHPAQYGPDSAVTGGGTFGRQFDYLDLRRWVTRYGDRADQYARSDAAKLAPHAMLAGKDAANNPRYNTNNAPFGPFLFRQNDPPGTGYNPGPYQYALDKANTVRQLVTTHSSTIFRPELAIKGPPDMAGNRLPVARLGPLDLNRPLPDYRRVPTRMFGPDNVPQYNADASTDPTLASTRNAQLARQRFARDIFVRLVAMTPVLGDQINLPGSGVEYIFTPLFNPPADPTNHSDPNADYGYLRIAPTSVWLATLRELAQLAVNIVDYVDSDDVSTTFTFNPRSSSGFILNLNTGLPNYDTSLVPLGPAALFPGPGGDDLGNYMVFGTEAPKVALNEVYAELGNHRADYNPGAVSPPGPPMGNVPTRNFQKRFWVELFNTMANDPALPENGLTRLHYPAGVYGAPVAYSPYQVVVAARNAASPPTAVRINGPSNVTGSPKHPTASTDLTVLSIVDRYRYDPSAEVPADPVLAVQVPDSTDVPPITPGNASNVQQYVIQQHTGTGTGTTRQNVNGYMVLGPAVEFPGERASDGMNPPPNTGYIGATIRLETDPNPPAGMIPPLYASATDPTKPYSLEIDAGPLRGEADIAGYRVGHDVYLRRLANPYLPPNDPLEPPTSAGGLFDPTKPVNPYITVDRVENVVPNDNVRFTNPAAAMGQRMPTTPEPAQTSGGKSHPFAAASVQPQTVPQATSPMSTFFNPNEPRDTNPSGPAGNTMFRWLVHLDRHLVNPLELLTVSAVGPSRVTDRFLTTDPTTSTTYYQGHTAQAFLAPGTAGTTAGTPIPSGHRSFTWSSGNVLTVVSGMPGADQVREGFLVAALDYLTTRPLGGAAPVGGREHGRVNVNTMPHPAVAQAVFDAKLDTDTARANHFTDNNVYVLNQADTHWDRLTGSTNERRTFNTDGTFINKGDPVLPPSGAVAPPSGSITDTTIFRQSRDAATGTLGNRLFYNAAPTGMSDATHPNVVTEPLGKVWNNTTTTSNQFLVIMTVGFFEIRSHNPTTGQVVLGKELYKDIFGDLRQKYVAVIDRTNLATGMTYIPASGTYQTDGTQAVEKPWFTTLTQDILPGTYDPAAPPASRIPVTCTIAGHYYDPPLPPPTPMNPMPTDPPPHVKVYVDGVERQITAARPAPQLQPNEVTQIRIGFGDKDVNNGDGEWFTVTRVVSGANGEATLELTPKAALETPPVPVTYRYHPAGSPVSNVLLGNPGPQPAFEAFRNGAYKNTVVPYLVKLAPGS